MTFKKWRGHAAILDSELGRVGRDTGNSVLYRTCRVSKSNPSASSRSCIVTLSVDCNLNNQDTNYTKSLLFPPARWIHRQTRCPADPFPVIYITYNQCPHVVMNNFMMWSSPAAHQSGLHNFVSREHLTQWEQRGSDAFFTPQCYYCFAEPLNWYNGRHEYHYSKIS